MEMIDYSSERPGKLAKHLAWRANRLGHTSGRKLAAAMGVNQTTASRWLSGASPIPPWVWTWLDLADEVARCRGQLSGGPGNSLEG